MVRLSKFEFRGLLTVKAVTVPVPAKGASLHYVKPAKAKARFEYSKVSLLFNKPVPIVMVKAASLPTLAPIVVVKVKSKKQKPCPLRFQQE